MNDAFRISRRTVLRGLGTAIALPALEAMLPTHCFAAPNAKPNADKPPVRIAFLCVPNGKHMPDWTPEKEGPDFDLRPTLEPVAKYKKQMLQLSGLTLNGARALGDGGGDHARSCAAFLTGAHPKKTHGADITNGISIDQVMAEKIGDATRFASLELGVEGGAQSGNCDSGYSCAYSSNLAWRTPTSPVGKEVNPAAVFDRLFGAGSSSEQSKAKSKRALLKKSVLDFASEDANSLRKRLGVSDQRKLDEYEHAIREIERRLLNPEKSAGGKVDVSNYPRPEGQPREFAEHVRLMFDMMSLAFQTDSTRVISFLMLNEGSNRAYKEIEISEGHHELSHHGNDAKKQEKIAKINRYHVTLLAHFLDRLSAIKEGDGTLLDNSLIMYGSGIGDGNRHNHDDLPITLFGRGGGTFKTGQHLRFDKETPLTNLYVSMLNAVGAPTKEFGDSNGRLENVLA